MRAALMLSLVLILVAAGAARAQSPQADRKKAEQHYAEGKKAYDAGDYPKAVQGFLAAYQLVPTNPLLFNIGQAYRLSGDRDKALSYYEKYVAFEPNGAQVPEAKEHIQKLKQEIEDQRRQEEAREAERQAREREAAQARAEEEKRRSAELLGKQRAEAQEKGAGLRTGGLVVGGVGVAAIAAGAVLGATDTFDAKSVALMGAGGAAVIAGGVMYFIGVKQRGDAEAALPKTSLIVPRVTGDSLGVVWITAF